MGSGAATANRKETSMSDIRGTIESLAASGEPFRLADVRAALAGRSYSETSLADELKAAEQDGLLRSRWVASEPGKAPSPALDEEALYAAFAAATGVERETEEISREEYDSLTAKAAEARRVDERAEAERARSFAEREAAENAEVERIWQKWSGVLTEMSS